jgi:hypothetical protein
MNWMPVSKEPFLARSFARSEGVPPLPEEMVAFYTGYIPVKLKGQPDKIASAYDALKARDQLLLESILNPSPFDVDLSKIARMSL